MGFILVQILTGLSSAASLFLVAAGLSLIFGVTRVVNFAHGSFYMLGAYIGLTLVAVFGDLFGRGHLAFWSALLCAALIVGAIGALVEIVILRRIYRSPELFQLVATFGVILVIQDLTLWGWGPQDLLGPRAPDLRGAIMIMGEPLPRYDLVLIAAGPVVLLLFWLLLNKTRFGILVRAATADREMVGALGVNQAWLFTGVFFLGSFLAGLGGALQLPKGGANLLMDFGVLAAAFVVVVVGGMGSIAGAFLAAVLIGQLQAFGVLFVPQSTLVMMFLVMAVVLVVRPFGLLGRPELVGQGRQMLDDPLRPTGWRFKILALVLVALLVAAPLWLGDYGLVLLIDILILALFATALHAIIGPGGLVSFGHAAYFGGGAYAAALLVKYAGTPMSLNLVLAPPAAALLALAIGWFCVRLSGVYFAMLTLAFAQIVWSVVFQWGTVTGGDDGLLGIWPAPWASDRVAYYWLVLACCTAGILALRHGLHSPFGYALRAGRDSPLRAEAIGIDVRRQQWVAFTLSGAFAGLAGGLYAYAKGSVFPNEMAIARSFDGIIMVFFGGVQQLSGPLAGAAALTWLKDLLFRLEMWRLLLGLAVIAVVLLFPQGLAGFLKARFGRFVGIRPELSS
ncbi:MAG: ABC transporter permease [Geminicoccaceae bacterium]|nr:ABC transporter permease [Geminicoccaceae bacterium]HRY25832.1 ABC transporter permease [Geminicoccaceae bacterium]